MFVFYLFYFQYEIISRNKSNKFKKCMYEMNKTSLSPTKGSYIITLRHDGFLVTLTSWKHQYPIFRSS